MVAVICFSWLGCELPSDKNDVDSELDDGGDSGDDGGDSSSVQTPADLWGRWLSMSSSAVYYVGNDFFLIDQQSNVISSAGNSSFYLSSGGAVSLESENIALYHTAGGSILRLYRDGGARASISGRVVSPMPKALSLAGIGGMNVILSNLVNEENEVPAVTAIDGTFEIDDVILEDDYSITVDEGGDSPITLELSPDNDGENIGLILITGKGYGFKCDVTPGTRTAYAQVQWYDVSLVIRNFGNTPTGSFSINLTSLTSNLALGGELSPIFSQGIEAGGEVSLEFQCRASGLSDEFEDLEVEIEITDADGDVYGDLVSLRFYKEQMEINIRSLGSVNGMIISPEGLSFPFSCTGEESITVPRRVEDYVVALTGASADTETVYSVGVNTAAEPEANLQDFANVWAYESNDEEAEMAAVPFNNSFTAYLHKNDADFYRVTQMDIARLLTPFPEKRMDDTTPELSWEGVPEGYYQVQIADTSLFRDQDLLLDEETSSESITPGTALEAWNDIPYYWRVRIRNNDGTWSLWCNPARFFLGIPAIYTVAGERTSFVIKDDGIRKTLWGWGYNAHGQVGDGTTTTRTTPVEITLPIGEPVAVSCRENFTLAVNDHGYLYGWGNNSSDKLGFAHVENYVTTPTRIGSFGNSTSTRVVDVAAGTNHSAVVLADGSVWTWGLNNVGQLGRGDDNPTTPSITPVKVSVYDWQNSLVDEMKYVAVGYDFTIAGGDGVYAWGNNNFEQLGKHDNPGAYSSKPVPVWRKDNPVVSVTAGGPTAMAVFEDGSCFIWGYISQVSGLGAMIRHPYDYDFYEVFATDFVKAAELGETDNLNFTGSVILNSGEVWFFNDNRWRAFGNPESSNNIGIRGVEVENWSFFTNIQSGQSHSLGLDSDGRVFVAGSSSNTELLGLGGVTSAPTPTEILWTE